VHELLRHAWVDLEGGVNGPLRFRFLIQPLVAVILAARAGVRDARAGHPPFLWALIAHRGHRREDLRRGWKDVERLFLVAVLVDLASQLIARRAVSPLQALLVAALLALVPYLFLAGPLNRIARWRSRVREPASN
jgi:hypothetical protein